jgi:glycosyltransferase involved in cell wall biosynthesis
MPQRTNSRPLVSVILPVYNEAAHIEQVVHSILGQSRAAFDLEILAIDGNSTDGTPEILQAIAGSNPEVRVLANPRRMTPLAFNIGLEHARGEYICIFGAHTAYDKNYIETCLAELEAQNAIGCGGRVLTTAANASLQARLVAAAMGSAFGTSSKSFRNHPQGFADTINYPVYLRTAVLELGGYDEQLYRNQDIDLNQRLRARGHRLYMTWKTSCRYFVQPTLSKMANYGWKTGFWNIISLRKNASAHGFYHFVPAIFVLACFLTSLTAASGWYVAAPYRVLCSVPLVLLLAMYFSVALIVSSTIALRLRWFAAFLLPFVFFTLHASYGLGTLWALFSNAKSPEAERAGQTLKPGEAVQESR